MATGTFLSAPNLAGGLVAVHVWHLTVHEHQCIRSTLDGFDSFAAGRHGVRFQPKLLQLEQCDLLIYVMVFGYEDEIVCRRGNGCVEKRRTSGTCRAVGRSGSRH